MFITQKRYFIKGLLRWNTKDNNRIMPWKGEKDPYKIWLSEIILQQTRVDQGLGYYNRFITTFTDIKKLANAPEQKVFKLWEGLGYYTRCKNLVATAKYIDREKNGIFPETYQEILDLKGIGPYTAAAIASFAFNLPHAVVDGNVYRVLSRFFGIEMATATITGKKYFTALAEELLDKKFPGIYNQAIMDFGAVICKPKNPLCTQCPLKTRCIARLTNKIDELPVKAARLIKKKRWFYYLIFEYNGKVYTRKRGAKDIWENLNEFVLLETGKPITVEKIKANSTFKKIAGKSRPVIVHVSEMYRQQLTHQSIHSCFIQVKLEKPPQLKDFKAVGHRELSRLPFPKIITAYLQENELTAFVR